VSDRDNEFNRGYDDPTYKGLGDPRAASEGRYARQRDDEYHESVMRKYRPGNPFQGESSGGSTAGGGGSRGCLWFLGLLGGIGLVVNAGALILDLFF